MLAGGIDLLCRPADGTGRGHTVILPDGRRSCRRPGSRMDHRSACRRSRGRTQPEIFVDPLGLHRMVATLATFMGLKAISLISAGRCRGSHIRDYHRLEIHNGGVYSTGGDRCDCRRRDTGNLFSTKPSLAFSPRVGSRREAARMAGIRPRRMLLTALCELLGARRRRGHTSDGSVWHWGRQHRREKFIPWRALPRRSSAAQVFLAGVVPLSALCSALCC